MNNSNQKLPSKELIVASADLPTSVFRRNFRRYAFFDVDFAAADEFVSAVQDFVSEALPGEEGVVLLSGDGSEVGRLAVASVWADALWAIASHNRACDIAWGLSLIGMSGEWAIYQKYPVSYGVIGWDFEATIEVGTTLKDYTFDETDLRRWLAEVDADAKRIVAAEGRQFLNDLLYGYSRKSGS